MDDTTLKELESKQWILRFTETYYYENFAQDIQMYQYEVISNVTILRLKFATDGKIYNLGVVSNKQTGSLIPDNSTDFGVELSDSVKDIFKLLALILVLLLGVFLFRIIRPIVSVVGTVVTAPFKGIKSLTKRKKRRK